MIKASDHTHYTLCLDLATHTVPIHKDLNGEEVVDLSRVYPTADIHSWPLEEFLQGYLPKGGERE